MSWNLCTSWLGRPIRSIPEIPLADDLRLCQPLYVNGARHSENSKAYLEPQLAITANARREKCVPPFQEER